MPRSGRHGANHDGVVNDRAEVAPLSGEALFATVFRESPVGMALVGLDFRVERANPVFCAITGYDEDELVGRGFAEITHPDDVAEDVELAGRLLRGELPRYQLEKRYVRKDGGVVWVSLSRSLLRDDGGRALKLVAIIQDLTERKALEEALRRSERHFRALIENARDMVLVLDRDGRNTYVSPANERQVGWAAEERLGRAALELVHPDDVGRVQAALAALLGDPGASASAEYRWRHKDGRWMWVEATGHNLLADPAVHGIVVNSREITERKLAEEKLAASESYHRALLENALDLVWVVDLSGATRFVSSSIERVTGHTPAELIGRSVFSIVHPDDLARTTEVFARSAPQHGVREVVEVRLLHKNGGVRHVEVVGQSFVDDPVVGGVVLNSRDITERKLAEERLQRSEAYFRALIEQVSDAVTVLEPDGTLRYLSPSIRKILGYDPDELVGTPLVAIVHPDDQARIASEVAAWPTAPEEASGSTPARFRARRKDGTWRTLEGTGRISFDDPLVRGVIGSVRDVSNRVAAEQERERLIGELQAALEQVKTLEGLLPICSSCKRVRDDQGYWTQIESYLSAHSHAEFSHGICPRCAKDLYPAYFADKPTDEIR